MVGPEIHALREWVNAMILTVETWCEALESGKYKQGTDCLRSSGDRFCCLGVACDVSGLGMWADGIYIADRANSAFLPFRVQIALGLTSNDGAFEFGTLPNELRDEIARETRYTPPPLPMGVATLSGLNDSGVSFLLIAKVIRARPKGLFREDTP